MTRRVLWSIPVLIAGSFLMFMVLHMTRDPVRAAQGQHVSPEALIKYKHDLGLDRPLLVQYWTSLSNFFRGNFGTSFTSQGAVWPQLRTALVNSFVLAVVAGCFYVLIGVIFGVISAVKQYSWFDHASTGASFIGLSIPPFVSGLLLILLVGTVWQSLTGSAKPLLPFIGGVHSPQSHGLDLVDHAKQLILPVIVLSIQEIAIYSRYMRTGMLETINADYIRTARAKGIPERRVIFNHAFRNALIPLTTFSAIDFGALAGGLIITEAIFNYQGMGLYFLDHYHNGDYPALIPWIMVVIIFVVVFNVLADLSYAWLDPRIRID